MYVCDTKVDPKNKMETRGIFYFEWNHIHAIEQTLAIN